MATLHASATVPDNRHTQLTTVAWPALALFAALTALAIGWVGYTASDDAAYHAAAQAWLAHPPVAGADHWATRFPLVLSLAAALRVLGDGPAAMTATALGWYAVFLLAVHALAHPIAGRRGAWIAVLLLGTLPVVIAQATTVSCDLTEASFLLLGARLAGDVAARSGGRCRAGAAGLAFGGAILCRETTALSLFGMLPLFALGRPLPRRALIALGLGVAAVLGVEALYQWALTGDALHRWTLAFHHDSHIDRAANLEGNVLVHPAIDPVLVLLVNDDFALLFWAALAASAARPWRTLDQGPRRRLLVPAVLAASTFLLVGALTTKLVLNPRYFMLPAVAATVLVAAWTDRLRAGPRALILTALVGANLLMLSVENDHPRWPAEALVLAARQHPGVPIRGDAETVHRAELPLAWAGIRSVSAGPPVPGALLLVPVRDGAPTIARYPSPPTVLGRLLAPTGVTRVLPDMVRRRLLAPNPTMVLVAAH